MMEMRRVPHVYGLMSCLTDDNCLSWTWCYTARCTDARTWSRGRNGDGRSGRYLPCAVRRSSERSGHRSANFARMQSTLLVHVHVLVMGSRAEKVHRNGDDTALSTSCRPSRHAKRSNVQSERHERKVCVVSWLHWSSADRSELRREAPEAPGH